MTSTALLANARLITTNRTTTSGAVLHLTDVQALNRDCTPLGDIVVKVTTEPDHGKISITQGSALSNYKPGDPPYLCNDHKTPATLVSYRADSGYVGPDAVVIQIFFPDGRAPMVRYSITVD